MTRKEDIIVSIRESIIKGEYKPDERLKELLLCQRFKVSRTPIREALNQLEKEGFIQITRGVGARIVKLSVNDISQIYEMLIILECGASQIAASQISNHEIIALEENQFAMEKAVKDNKINLTFELNNQFHGLIASSTRNSYILDVRTNFWRLIEGFGRMNPFVPGQLEATLKEHRAIIEALRARNSSETASITRDHFESARDRLFEHLRGFFH